MRQEIEYVNPKNKHNRFLPLEPSDDAINTSYNLFAKAPATVPNTRLLKNPAINRRPISDLSYPYFSYKAYRPNFNILATDHGIINYSVFVDSFATKERLKCPLLCNIHITNFAEKL